MAHTFNGRDFRIWDFSVHHSRLLIRSQPTLSHDYNIDLIFTAVDYISVPKHLDKLEIDSATQEEYQSIQKLFKREITKDEITILVSNGSRNFIAAAGFEMNENELELFDSGLDR
ncbi:hypothetical protein [Gimesia sp.]|uniref:hypothetical protein n=1 Tax=Gimesia sp. TaxID=2024833 RepID=UPI003A8D849F